jgi:hypothetical protein
MWIQWKERWYERCCSPDDGYVGFQCSRLLTSEAASVSKHEYGVLTVQEVLDVKDLLSMRGSS